MVGASVSSTMPTSISGLPLISKSPTISSVEHPSTTTTTTREVSPTAVEGGEGAFGNDTRNETGNSGSGNSTGHQAKSEAGRRLSNTTESVISLIMILCAFWAYLS